MDFDWLVYSTNALKEMNDKICDTIFWCKVLDTFEGVIFACAFASFVIFGVTALDYLRIIDIGKWRGND